MITGEMLANCNGCHACFSVCPAKCISMTEDREGFLYPAVREGECLKCGKCLLVCPLNRAPETRECTCAYAAANKSDEVLGTSSSGGVFRALAEAIIHRGGTVYGAAFAPDFCSVSHMRVCDLADLGRLQGSKYLQSAIGDAYRAAESDLREGRWVLFSGAPCQIGGLRNYLATDYPRLITQDLVCHGVPSHMVWERYLAFRARSKKARVASVNMRDKTFGWRRYSMRIGFSDGGNYLCRATKDPYIMGFLQNLYLRPSCHKCVFKSARRQSDLTLADKWGDDSSARRGKNRGVSLVGIHTEKGQVLFAEAKGTLTAKQTDWAEALSFNPSALRSFPVNPNRERFFRALETEGFAEAVFPCLTVKRRDRLFAILKGLVKLLFNHKQ